MQVQKQQSKRTEQVEADETYSEVTNGELAESTDQVLDSIEEALDAQLDEDILAEMDGVLEVNAEEFVRDYIQEGGE